MTSSCFFLMIFAIRLVCEGVNAVMFGLTPHTGAKITVIGNVHKLNALHDELKDLGFTILGFPCNQFGKQEPGYNHEILPMLKHIRPGKGFVPNFHLFETGDVNGINEQSVFTFLK
ncbi:glutathione peroxidase 3, partial [Clarias magur]